MGNRVAIFYNGIADFQRVFTVEKGKPTEIQIPVKAQHIADVLASLSVWGDVTIAKPPTYRPSNEKDGNLTLNANSVVKDLGVKLSGSKVRVTTSSGKTEGVLMGLQEDQEGTAGEPVGVTSYIFSTASGIEKIKFRDANKVEFLDEAVNSEISKALQRNYQTIKPNSTFVSLTLTTDKDRTDATVQYTVPAAAWKISYRLRENGSKTNLQAFAVVDNNTDEDWNDFRIAFVTGEPVTFETDLAESKVPRRSRRNVVKQEALAGYEAEDGMEACYESAGASRGMAKSMSFSAVAACAAPAGGMMRGARGATGPQGVQGPTGPDVFSKLLNVSAKEVGDFSIFESANVVSIAANRSAIVPVLSVNLSGTKSVAHYKSSNHAERPYRCLSLKNDTKQSLGEGVVTVYTDGVFSGSAIFPAMKPGEDRMVPHALETGIKVRRTVGAADYRIASVTLAKGLRKVNSVRLQETTYRVVNSREGKKDKFEFVLDHDNQMGWSDTIQVSVNIKRASSEASLTAKESLNNGTRYSFDLNPSETVVLTVTEKLTEQQEYTLLDEGLGWMEQAHFKGAFSNSESIKKVAALQKKLDAKDNEIEKLAKEVQRLTDQQIRLRESIKSVGGTDGKAGEWTDGKAGEWIAKLATAEDRITAIESSDMPKWTAERDELQEKVNEALEALSEEWVSK
jgi:hypothetical protein